MWSLFLILSGFTLLALDLPNSAPRDLQPRPLLAMIQCFGWDEMLRPLLVTRYLNNLLQKEYMPPFFPFLPSFFFPSAISLSSLLSFHPLFYFFSLYVLDFFLPFLSFLVTFLFYYLKFFFSPLFTNFECMCVRLFRALVSKMSSAGDSAQALCVRAWIRCIVQQYQHSNTDTHTSRTGRQRASVLQRGGYYLFPCFVIKESQ